MPQSDRSKNLRRPLCLIRFHVHLVASHLLVMFLSQYGDYIKGRAAGQRDSNKLNRFRASRSGSVIQNDVVARTGFRNELPL
jgi:hypothetical protein